MELRSLAVFLGLCLLAVSQCSEARHSIERRNADEDDIFAADEASDGEGTQNDDLFGDSKQEANTIAAIQATILTKPKTYKYRVGEEARLECQVSPDNGTVVQWFRNGTLIFIGGIKVGENDRYTMHNDSKDLLIKDLEPTDSTVFRCEVAQETDPVNVEHNLEVLEPPRIVRFTATNKGNLVEGDNLMLTCDTRGRPPPQIYWARYGADGGTHRLGEADGEFTSNSVFIRNVNKEHSGLYYCYIKNKLGNHQAELMVSIALKPRVVVHRTVVNSAINVEAVLQCSERTETKPYICWYKDGRLIEDSSTHYIISTNGPHSNLTMTPTSAADFGVYTCEAENYYGKHNRSIELVQKPVVESLGADSGKLSWTIHSHQPLQEITAQVHQLGVDGASEWQDIKIPIPSKQHHKYEVIYDLRDEVNVGKYEAIVKVKNDHSWSDAVDPVIFDIEIEPQSIQHASVYGGNSHSIRPSSIVLSSMLMYVLVRLL